MLDPFLTAGSIEAGCDEAGRGCIAGPVYAAAVILPANLDIEGLDDSKKLTELKRIHLRRMIEKHALAYAVAGVDPEEIDEINILNASFLAMHRALDQLALVPEQLLVDGNRFTPYKDIPHHCIVKGDGKFMAIAAASILAKTYRDEHMEMLHNKYPAYAWDRNKGYPTKEHRQAIKSYGVTPCHRKSFRLTDEQLSLDL